MGDIAVWYGEKQLADCRKANSELHVELAKLLRDNVALKKDALRYRFLRTVDAWGDDGIRPNSGDLLEADGPDFDEIVDRRIAMYLEEWPDDASLLSGEEKELLARTESAEGENNG